MCEVDRWLCLLPKLRICGALTPLFHVPLCRANCTVTTFTSLIMCEHKKLKIVPFRVMKAYRRSRGTAPLILNLRIRWWWVVNFTPRRERTLVPLLTGGWADPKAHVDILEKRNISVSRPHSNTGSSSHYTDWAIPIIWTTKSSNNFVLCTNKRKYQIISLLSPSQTLAVCF
jgi:hypothetical protein